MGLAACTAMGRAATQVSNTEQHQRRNGARDERNRAIEKVAQQAVKIKLKTS
jgi:hypothetical protein